MASAAVSDSAGTDCKLKAFACLGQLAHEMVNWGKSSKVI